jgi:hypothetical protein
LKLQLPEGVAEQIKGDARDPESNGRRQEKEWERLNSQLDAAARATFGVLDKARERADLPLILESVDRILAVVEAGRRLRLEEPG